MKLRSISLLLCSVLLGIGVGGGEERTLTIIDKPVPDSPVENVGSTVLLVKQVDGGRLAVSHADDWTVKNISKKPIVAMVESLLIGGNHGVLFDRKAQYDAFFHPKVTEPGMTVPFSQDSYGEDIMDPKYQPPVAPSAEVIVRWVQFTDGTTFGDASYAQSLLADRAAIMKALQRLREVYLSGGAEKFVQQLQQRAGTPFADAYIGHIRSVQQKRGTQTAIETLLMHLSVAEGRPGFNGAVP